jgi:hypothetical protein
VWCSTFCLALVISKYHWFWLRTNYVIITFSIFVENEYNYTWDMIKTTWMRDFSSDILICLIKTIFNIFHPYPYFNCLHYDVLKKFWRSRFFYQEQTVVILPNYVSRHAKWNKTYPKLLHIFYKYVSILFFPPSFSFIKISVRITHLQLSFFFN